MNAIFVHNLRYRYPRGDLALDGVSMAVNAGERVGIIGPNGAGKTTLFLCLSGVLPIAAGMVSQAKGQWGLSGRQFSLGLGAACTDGAARAIKPASIGGITRISSLHRDPRGDNVHRGGLNNLNG